MCGISLSARPGALVITIHTSSAVRAGILTSRHIPDRNQRLRPLGLAVAAAITGLASLHLLRAVRQLVALVAVMLIGLVVTAAITRLWKISLQSPGDA